MEWMKYSEYNLPPQGLKVLCLTKGDVFVAQTFNYTGKRYWLPIPFCDSVYALQHMEAPEYWAYIALIGDLRGLMKVSIDGSELLTMDQFEQRLPQEYHKFVKVLIEGVGKRINEKNI